MVKGRGWFVTAALLAAASARAQTAEQESQKAEEEAQEAAQQARDAGQLAQATTGQQPTGAVASSPDARPLVERCEALLRGELTGDATLQSQCAALLRSNGGGGGTSVQPGVSREGATAGQSVGAAFTTAGHELFGQGQKVPLGMRRSGPITNLLTTNPIGWFNGFGVNATLSRVFKKYDKLSWVGQARYSRTNGSNGNVTAFGIGAGADYFVMGKNNEGLRLGPRLSASFGSEDFGGETSFGMLGMSGELGYNFVATNGIAATIAGGFGAQIAGDEQNAEWEDFAGGDFGPYFALGLGYAW
jgi:hypothetical protein